MIAVHHVSKHYPQGKQALNNVSFQLHQGDMAFLTGHSGAGKSTLLKLLLSMERCSSGQLFVNGRNINQLTRRQIPYFRRDIGMIHQSPYLLEDRTVFDNVAMPLIIRGLMRKAMQRQVASALDQVGLLAQYQQKPSQLSIGECQRVGIARAIVNQPSILLADEPTGNLDPKLSLHIIQLLEQCHQRGTTVFIATHDVHIIEQCAQRTLVLHQGQLVDDQRWSTESDG